MSSCFSFVLFPSLLLSPPHRHPILSFSLVVIDRCAFHPSLSPTILLSPSIPRVIVHYFIPYLCISIFSSTSPSLLQSPLHSLLFYVYHSFPHFLPPLPYLRSILIVTSCLLDSIFPSTLSLHHGSFSSFFYLSPPFLDCDFPYAYCFHSFSSHIILSSFCNTLSLHPLLLLSSIFTSIFPSPFPSPSNTLNLSVFHLFPHFPFLTCISSFSFLPRPKLIVSMFLFLPIVHLFPLSPCPFIFPFLSS